MKDMSYKIDLFTDEATLIWDSMPGLIEGLVAKKREAVNQFNKLDTIVNGGELKQIGKVFGESIYARFDVSDPEESEYKAKQLSLMMGYYPSDKPKVITFEGKRYTVLLEEDSFWATNNIK